LRGHTSTVRCIQSAGYKSVVSGSRDTTLRVWDLEKGVSTKVLVGHSSSVRCLAVHGDLVVSGSYDYTAMVVPSMLFVNRRFGAFPKDKD
jgi:F-box and WD-40 domain protein CDC4